MFFFREAMFFRLFCFTNNVIRLTDLHHDPFCFVEQQTSGEGLAVLINDSNRIKKRKKGFEPSIFALAKQYSTSELFPLIIIQLTILAKRSLYNKTKTFIHYKII